MALIMWCARRTIHPIPAAWCRHWPASPSTIDHLQIGPILWLILSAAHVGGISPEPAGS
jgi:hypothetical protein